MKILKHKQGQVCHAVQFFESRGVGYGLIHAAEVLSLNDLEYGHRVKSRGCLARRGVDTSSEGQSSLTRLGQVGELSLPSHGSGRAEVRGH
ncbi:hypothetical protein cypCar_00044961 [Cyprinus carpio]|nr:hypothetical protein cypCar_00044961 [Cyprinus carpio]